ncbi:MAG: ATP-binding protein [Halobacteriota archaeon]|nr:ATP-binding protein [Halobacteriota archaeon]
MDEEKNILIVDDDPAMLRTLSDILGANGFTTIGAANGREAIDSIKNRVPTVALIDLNLGDMYGTDVIKKIKGHWPNTEFIVLTGHASQASAIDAVNLGAHSYFQKPHDMEQLLISIRKAFEKHEHLKALEEGKNKYHELIETSDDPIFKNDLEGNLLFVNEAFKKVHGYSEDELTDTTFYDLIHPDDLLYVKNSFKKAIKGESVKNVEYRCRTKCGLYVDISINASPIISTKGDVIGVMGIGRDITERRMAEEDIKRAYEELKKVDKMKGDFAAMATHEIGTPLTIIKTNIEMLEDGMFGEIPEDQLKRLKVIKKNADHLVKLNREMMDISRIDAGKLRLRKEYSPVSDIIRDASKDLETFAENKKIEIIFDISDENYRLNCDGDRIRQVVRNLVKNAIKFTAEGGKIEVGFEDMGDCILVRVFDNGIGIPKEEHENIFKRFYELGSSQGEENEGTGLGLAIVKGIVEAHGGEVWIESAPGEGSIFYFTIPV